MPERLKGCREKLNEKSRSLSRSSSPIPQDENISVDTNLQASNDLALIRRTDKGSGTTMPTMLDLSKQSQSTKPVQAGPTQAGEEQLPEPTIKVSLSHQD
jgi:hypothetical protein